MKTFAVPLIALLVLFGGFAWAFVFGLVFAGVH
jgi:hypothetical protein